MENRNEFKSAIQEHLIKMIAEEIAKEPDFEALKAELKSELMKVERKDTRSEREKAEEYIPYSTPTTERERAYKKELGFFMKEDFEKQLEKKISAEKTKNKMVKHAREEEVENLLATLNRPRLEPHHPSTMKTFLSSSSSLMDRLQQIKNSSNFNYPSQILTPNDNPEKTDYSMVDNVHQLKETEKPFEPLPEKEFKNEAKKTKAIRLKKTKTKITPVNKNNTKTKVKKVTAGKKPRKK